MTAPDLVGAAPAARRAWGWLPAVLAPGRIYVGPGVVLIARTDGGVDEVLQGGHQGRRSIAADPFPTRGESQPPASAPPRSRPGYPRPR